MKISYIRKFKDLNKILKTYNLFNKLKFIFNLVIGKYKLIVCPVCGHLMESEYHICNYCGLDPEYVPKELIEICREAYNPDLG